MVKGAVPTTNELPDAFAQYGSDGRRKANGCQGPQREAGSTTMQHKTIIFKIKQKISGFCHHYYF